MPIPEKETMLELTTSWKEEGSRHTLLRLLDRRVGSVPTAVISRIEALDADGLDALADAVLDFATLDDLTRWVDARA